MGAARSKMVRALRRPIESQRRVNNILEMDKPTPAPRHPTVKLKENPEVTEDLKKQDNSYLTMLSQLRVESVDPSPKTEAEKLPKGDPTASGVSTKVKRPLPGRLTYDQILQLFSNRRKDPSHWTETKIAEHYRLTEKTVNNLLKYYGDFYTVDMPKPYKPLEKVTF